MKKSIHKILVTTGIITFMLVSACQKFLEVEPIGVLDETTLTTKAGVNGLLIGAYSLLDQMPNPGWCWGGKFIFGGMASDDANGVGIGYFTNFDSYNYTPQAEGLNGRWGWVYDGVQRSNEVLRMLAKMKEAGKISDEEALQIEAEARFLRGVYHLEGAIMWRNIPYVDETVSFANDNYYVSNANGPIWDMIEADFQFAGENLTETKADVGRANSWAAKAFLVKTYVFDHKYNEAKPLLDDIIANGVTSLGKKYALNENFFDNFNAATKHGPEEVFAVQMSVHDGANGANGNGSDMLNGPFGGPAPCCGAYQPTFSLVNSYKTDPVTGLPLFDTFNDEDLKNDQGIASDQPFEPDSVITLDSRLDWTVGRRGIPFLDWGNHPGMAWVRFPDKGGPYHTKKNANFQAQLPDVREGWNNASNYNMIRFADVLLWAAEVEVEVGSLAKAEEYVNMVRARAANPDGWVKKYNDPEEPMAGYSDEPAANYFVGLYNGEFEANGKDYARRAVHFERKLELAMEHHRFFDLQRWNDDNPGSMAELLNAHIQHETNVPNFHPTHMYGATFVAGKHEIYPIPQVQIDKCVVNGSSTLIQNGGW